MPVTLMDADYYNTGEYRRVSPYCATLPCVICSKRHKDCMERGLLWLSRTTSQRRVVETL